MAAFGGADRKPRQIVVPIRVQPGHFGGFAADQRAPGNSASFGNAGDNAAGGFNLQFSGCEVIQKKQGLGALNHKIVHAHCHEIDANCVMAACGDGDFKLCAYAICGCNKNGILESGGFRIEQRTESPERCGGSGPGRSTGERPDRLDQSGAGVDINARCLIGVGRFVGWSRYGVLAVAAIWSVGR